MTFARLLETGSGLMAARLVIEGLAVQFVSDPNMERSASMDGALAKTNDDVNLFPGTPSWTPDVGATASSGYRDPIAGTDAWRIAEESASALDAITDAVSYTTGNELWVSLWVRRDATALNFISIDLVAGASAHGLYLRLSDGAAAGIGTVNDLTVTHYPGPVGSGLADWYFVAFRCPGDGSAVAAFLRVAPAAGLAASFPTTSAAATGGVIVYGPRIADRTDEPDISDPTAGVGRERVYCFNLTGESSVGLSIDESVNIPEAILDAPGTSIRLFERDDEVLAQHFFWKPDLERWITSTVEVADTTVTLLSASGVEPDQVVSVGTEAMLVTGVASNVITVERGYWNSVAQKHWSNEGTIAMRTLHNRPMRIRGRRVYLHLYGDADDLAGEGTQVWIGHVSGEPSCDEAGTVYRLQLASNAERLKGKLGGELGAPVTPRGIYYSWQAPLSVIIIEGGSIRINTRVTNNVTGSPPRHFTGFFETQQDFCDAFNTWLASAWESAPTHSYRAEVTPDGGWTVAVTIDSGGLSGSHISLRLWSPIDGHLRGGTSGSTGGTGLFVDRDGSDFAEVAGTTGYARRELDATLYTPPAGAGFVPRGFFGRLPPFPFRHGDGFVAQGPAALTAPNLRIYARVTADCDTVQIEWPHGYTTDYNIDDRDDAAGWIELSHGYVGLDSGGHGDLGTFYATFDARQLRSLATGTLADLRDALVANGPEYCNLLGNPFLTSADLASWDDVVADATRGRSWLQNRIYQLFISMDLEDLLQHEMRLYGIFPIVDSTGKIGVQSLARVTSGATAADIVIDDEIITVGWSSRSRGQQTVNMIELKTGYDVREDEHLGRSIYSQDMPAFALDHEERSIEIEPRSRAFIGDENIDPIDAADVIKTLSDVFGYPHDFVTVHVPWTHFHLRLGDPVSFTAHHLPDFRTGRRPTTAARGIVVARKWTLGDAHGTLKLLLHGLAPKGYAPSARITSQSNPSGNDWLITVDASMNAPADAATDEFYAAGDKIRIVEYDSESPTIVTGEVTSVDTVTHIVGLTLDGAWTPGAATWDLEFSTYDLVTDDQKTFAFIAEDGMLGDDGADVYSP